VWLGPSAARTTSEGAPFTTLRLLQANVLFSNRDYELLLELAERESPDIVVLEKITEDWFRAIAPLWESYAYKARSSTNDHVSIVLLSRVEMTDVAPAALGETPSETLIAMLHPPGCPAVRVLAAHPRPPISRRAARWRASEIRGIAKRIAQERAGGEPMIVAGDFNATPWSPLYREVRDAGGLVSARDGFGVLPTWPAFLPAPLRIPIDQVFLTEPIEVVNCRVGEAIGSDHLPLLVDLRIPAEPTRE